MNKFVEIGAVKQVRTAIDRARYLSFPICVTSAPGMGKTTTLLHECKNNNHVYVEASQAMNSVQGLYKGVLEAFGCSSEKSYIYELKTILKHRVKPGYGETPKLLIVDEFQTLSLTLQRELLSLHENLGFPLLLSGNPERLARTKADKNSYEQIRSRIGPIVEIYPPSKEDCERLGIAYKVEGIDAYKALTAFGCVRSVRDICRLLQQSRIFNDGGSIQLRHLEMAGRSLYGSKFRLGDRRSTAIKKGKLA
ncbi:MAG: ATP-binding protein [Pseudomonadota bacterium]